MIRINAGVQNCYLDRTVWSNAPVDLMRQRQANLFRRPLRHVRSEVAAHAPCVADTPRVPSTFRWFRNEVRFDENDARVMRQRVYSIFDGSVVCNPQSEY